jgi:two-component system sensor histidine kinase HydH
MTEHLDEPRRPPHQRSLPEALVRTLRHEVGDMLQKVYATVAILKDRLPPDKELERGVLLRMGSRAEICRRVLDTAHDFICPLSLSLQPTDLAQLANQVVAGLRGHYLNLTWTAESSTVAWANADPRRAVQIGELLAANAGEAAQSCVVIRTSAGPQTGEVAWTIIDDGPGVNPDQVELLFTPFFTTKAGHSGLGLALAQKLVLLHGGRITAANLPQGGFQAQVVFPAEPAKETSG